MRIVKELFRLAAVVWMILLTAVIVDVMTESAEACGTPDCVPTSTPYPTSTLVPDDESTRMPEKDDDCDDDDNDNDCDPTVEPTKDREDDHTSIPELTDTPIPTGTEKPDDDPTRTPEPTITPDPTPDPSPEPTDEPTDEPSFTPDPTHTLEPTVTKRPYDCHKDGDKICESDLTPVPLIIVFTSTPIPPTPTPTLAPTETSMVQAVTQAVACPNTCCSACCGCPGQAQVGIGSEVVDYSEVILEFKLIAYILTGIFGVNTLLKTYGTFRKD